MYSFYLTQYIKRLYVNNNKLVFFNFLIPHLMELTSCGSQEVSHPGSDQTCTCLASDHSLELLLQTNVATSLGFVYYILFCLSNLMFCKSTSHCVGFCLGTALLCPRFLPTITTKTMTAIPVLLYQGWGTGSVWTFISTHPYGPRVTSVQECIYQSIFLFFFFLKKECIPLLLTQKVEKI